MGGSLLHIFTNSCYDIFLILAILVGLKWHFIVVVIYIFLIANNIEYLFIFLLAVFISLEKCLFISFPQCTCYFHH